MMVVFWRMLVGIFILFQEGFDYYHSYASFKEHSGDEFSTSHRILRKSPTKPDVVEQSIGAFKCPSPNRSRRVWVNSSNDKSENISSVRWANLIVMNPYAARSRASTSILNNIGFKVRGVSPIAYPSDHVLSNFLTFHNIISAIAVGETWQYVFEDDLGIHKAFQLEELVQYEKDSGGFIYLGVCGGTWDEPYADGMKTPISQETVLARNSLGRCAHGFGLAPKTANELLDFYDPANMTSLNRTLIAPNENYFDRLIGIFCHIRKGCLTVGSNLVGEYLHHKGILFQDRVTYHSSLTKKRRKGIISKHSVSFNSSRSSEGLSEIACLPDALRDNESLSYLKKHTFLR